MRPFLLHKSADLFIDLLFPKRCLGCGREEGFLCLRCLRSLPRLTGPLCSHCGRPLAVEPCPYCRERKLAINGILAPFRFEGLVREMVHRFKYQNFKALAPSLAHPMVQYLDKSLLDIQVVVPVPLYSRRLRRRGYNQAALLARELSKLSSLPFLDGALTRCQDSPAQARALNAVERWANVAEAFTCSGLEVLGRRVLLVDDVCTTGATMDACARVLIKDGGAIGVWGLTFAREV